MYPNKYIDYIPKDYCMCFAFFDVIIISIMVIFLYNLYIFVAYNSFGIIFKPCYIWTCTTRNHVILTEWKTLQILIPDRNGMTSVHVVCTLIFMPSLKKCRGYYVIPSKILSVRPSVSASIIHVSSITLDTVRDIFTKLDTNVKPHETTRRKHEP